jgi:hypothetical protein
MAMSMHPNGMTKRVELGRGLLVPCVDVLHKPYTAVVGVIVYRLRTLPDLYEERIC